MRNGQHGMHGDGGSENAYEQEFVCQNDRVVGSNTFSPFFRGQYGWAPEILAAAQSVRRLVARFHAARAGRAQPFPLHPIGERSPGSAPAPQFSDRLRTRSCGRRCGTSKRFFGTDNNREATIKLWQARSHRGSRQGKTGGSSARFFRDARGNELNGLNGSKFKCTTEEDQVLHAVKRCDLMESSFRTVVSRIVFFTAAANAASGRTPISSTARLSSTARPITRFRCCAEWDSRSKCVSSC